MNNKQWEEVLRNEFKEKCLFSEHLIWNYSDEISDWFIEKINQREAEIRKEYEPKSFYETIISSTTRDEIRKETIEAVLPKSKRFKDHDIGNASDYGFNSAVKEIKDKAKEKFNINLE